MTLRPFANKDSYTVFVTGLIPTVCQQDIEKAFAHYQPLISCTMMQGGQQAYRNATITFGSKEVYNQLLVDYREDLALK